MIVSTVLLVFLSITIIAFSLYTGITPMPSSKGAQQAMVSACDSYHKQIFNICELGSGWGGLASLLARHFPQATVSAFELSIVPWVVSKIFQKIHRSKNLHIQRANFFKQSLKHADVVVCYLYPGAMAKLKLKCERELQPGSLVISNSFRIPGWVPNRVIVLNDPWRTEIFVYNVSKQLVLPSVS